MPTSENVWQQDAGSRRPHPAPSAVRRQAPRLCGSCTPSSHSVTDPPSRSAATDRSCRSAPSSQRCAPRSSLARLLPPPAVRFVSLPLPRPPRLLSSLLRRLPAAAAEPMQVQGGAGRHAPSAGVRVAWPFLRTGAPAGLTVIKAIIMIVPWAARSKAAAAASSARPLRSDPAGAGVVAHACVTTQELQDRGSSLVSQISVTVELLRCTTSNAGAPSSITPTKELHKCRRSS